MTQCFDEHGVCHPATVLYAPRAIVAAVKTAATDGYDAIALASPRDGATHTDIAAASPRETHRKEFRLKPQHVKAQQFNTGDAIDVSVFAPGDVIAVTATSKGKGFQGVVKRHGFSGAASKTHGTKHNVRAPGSIGASGRGKVDKGKRMAGRMGGNRVQVKNLKVLQVNESHSLLLVSGAVPGRKGSLVEVRTV